MSVVEKVQIGAKPKQRVLCAAYLLRVYLSVNTLGFTVSLPAIMKSYNALDFYPILIVLYSTSMTMLALIGGKIIDMIGVKRMTVIATAGVSLTAACAAFAPNLPCFVALYVLMGVCHGIGITMPVAIICSVTDGAERPRFMGLYSAANNVGLLVGPLLGGFVTDNLSYRITPLYPLAMPAVALYLIIRYYPFWQRPQERQTLDAAGSVLSILTIATFVVALNIGGKYFPWDSPVVYATVIAFVIFLAAFLLREKRSDHPLINLKLFRIPSFSAGVVMVLLAVPSINLAANYVTLFVQSGMGYSATFSGTFALPKTFFVILFTVFLGRWLLLKRIRQKFLLIAGGWIIVGGSLLLFAGIGDSKPANIAVLYVVTSLYGIGEGICYMILHPFYQKDIPEADLGSGVSVQTLCTTMGSALSATTYGAILNGFGGDINVAFPYMGLAVLAAAGLYLLLGHLFVKMN